MWGSDVHSHYWVTPRLPVWIINPACFFHNSAWRWKTFRVSRGLVMTTIDTVRCQPLWNQLLCQGVFIASSPPSLGKMERNSNWTPIFELRTDTGQRWTDLRQCILFGAWWLLGGVIIDQSEARIVTPGPIRSRDSDHILTDVIGTKNGPTWILTVDHYQSCLEPDIFTITGRISGLIITENNGECFIL